MIKEVKIPADYFKMQSNQSGDLITKLSRVNIFIGPNNSGKSILLRELFVNKELIYRTSDFDIKSFDLNLTNLRLEIQDHYRNYNVAKAENVDKILSGLIRLEFEKLSQNTSDRIDHLNSLINELSSLSSIGSVQLSYGNMGQIEMNNFIGAIKNSAFIFQKTLPNINSSFLFERFYIPILRGLRPIQLSSDKKGFDQDVDAYLERTVFDYFKSKFTEREEFLKFKERIFTGLSIYKELQHQLLNQRDSRENVKNFEDFLKKNFFNNNDVALIPQINSDVLLVGIQDIERLIYELGDGIQAVIQLLYPIYINKGKKCVFFIEEPELNMHPGMQRIFLDTLLKPEFSEMQFFITTHSNHFLDLSFDNKMISIYKFNKEKETEEFKITNLVNPDMQILGDLGVRNSSVFLSNCTIWVEGVTDRKYIRRFMELFIKKNSELSKFKEDLHYSFVEYAGSNITHWNFDEEDDKEKIKALRLNNKVLLIVDSDVNEQSGLKKSSRFDEFSNILKDSFYITEGKEIENILSPKTVKKIVAEYENISINDASLNFIEDKLLKRKSFNSDDMISKPMYWNINLGKYIEKGLKSKKRKGSYIDQNTIADKVAFCDKAISYLNDYEDLSPEAIILCEKIFKFIETSN